MAAADLSGPLDVDDIQGLVASGYGHLPAACYVGLAVEEPGRAAAWLGRLAGAVTDASGRREEAVNVALSFPGLLALQVPEATLAGFSDRFREGMTAPYRSRVLGDVDDAAPASWAWGGPSSVVDVLVLLYARDDEDLARLEQLHLGRLDEDGLRRVTRLGTTWVDREHFGFRDGIAQPAPAGLRRGREVDVVATGEFVLGYPNEYGALTPRPLLPPEADPHGLLPRDPEGSGQADLGRNGTYLVVRQLRQDVGAFWTFVEDRWGDAGCSSAVELAAKMVGRWPDGTPLVLAPSAPGDPGTTDDFAYHHLDPDGLRCPLGAHIRRAHPRDMLDPDPGTAASLAIDRRHRLLRRGRAYGPIPEGSAAPAPNDGTERGLHFISLCANIARQFEFVQHTWLLNPKFAGLYDDPDPLLGPPDRSFRIQAEPVRRHVTGLPAFVRMRGGGYFFLPGRRALRYLAGAHPGRAGGA